MNESKQGFGRTALITGASSGIGLELSPLFAADRYNLVVVGRSVEKLTALVTQLESEHEVRIGACPMDHGKENGRPRLRPHYNPNYYAAFVLGYRIVGDTDNGNGSFSTQQLCEATAQD